MSAITGCPEKIELYAFIDGELKEAAFARIDRHILECAACRDEVRRIKVFHRALFAAVGTDPEAPGDDSERIAEADRFLDGIMTRLVDQDAAQKAPAPRRRVLVGAGVLTLGIIVVIAWTFVMRETPKPSGPDLESARRAAAERAELVRIREAGIVETELADALRQGAGDRWSWRKPLNRFTELDLSLPAAIERIGRASGAGTRAEIARRLPGDLGFQSMPVLERLAADADLIVRTETCRALGRLATPAGLRLVRVAARDDVEISVVVDAMLATRSPLAEKAVRDLAFARIDEDPQRIVAAIEKRPGSFARDLLLDLYLGGAQSGMLVQALRARPTVIQIARNVAFTEIGEVARRERAIRLLGEMRDVPSAGRLERFLSTREYVAAAARSIAQIGGETAMVALARRLQPRVRDAADDDDRRRLAIESAVASFGDAGAEFFMRRVGWNDGFAAHYVIAAGLSGGAAVVSDLERLLDDDFCKGYAVQALGMIADRAGEGVLVKLTKSANQRIRERAAEALKKKRAPSVAPSRRGFVESDIASPPDLRSVRRLAQIDDPQKST